MYPILAHPRVHVRRPPCEVNHSLILGLLRNWNHRYVRLLRNWNHRYVHLTPLREDGANQIKRKQSHR
jgi:hypothetical protein